MPDSPESIWVVRQTGSAFGTRKPTDTEARWRLQAGSGVHQWGDGQHPPFASLGPTQQADGRVLFELMSAGPIGIVLNDGSGAAISLTCEQGKLVIRDERRGANHILATIGDAGITTP